MVKMMDRPHRVSPTHLDALAKLNQAQLRNPETAAPKKRNGRSRFPWNYQQTLWFQPWFQSGAGFCPSTTRWRTSFMVGSMQPTMFEKPNELRRRTGTCCLPVFWRNPIRWLERTIKGTGPFEKPHAILSSFFSVPSIHFLGAMIHFEKKVPKSKLHLDPQVALPSRSLPSPGKSSRSDT